MKKWFPTLFICLTLGVGGAAVYLFAKPATGAGSTAAASFLPSETIFLAAVPDLNRTVADFKTTDLYKIWSEPDVQAFLARPLTKLPPHAELTDALARADKLGLTNLFVALTSLDDAGQPHYVAGFQFKGSSADVDALLAKPKAEVRRLHPAAKADLINYEGHAIETVSYDERPPTASVYLKDWYMISNDLALLEATLDRAEHRGPAATGPTLDKDADYNAVLAKLPAGYATLAFGRAKAFLSKIMDLAEAGGQAIEPKQRAEAEKIRAAGATTGFENGKIRDTIYLYAPGISQEYAKLGMDSLPLTTADTVLYAASILNIPEKFDLPATPGGSAGAPAGLALFQGLGQMLSAHNVTLDGFRAAFGNEAGMALDWSAGQAQPTLLITLNVRDEAAAGKFVDNFTAALTAEAAWETAQFDGLTFHSVEIPNVPTLAPTLTVTPKHLLFGLNLPEVRAAAAREKAPVANFTGGDTYKKASDDVSRPNTSFGYLDAKAFFERFYGTLKPYAMTAAFLMPQVSEYVDLGKLPEPDVIARHLSPTVLSQTYTPEGCLLESVGSITFGQAAVAVVGGTAGAVSPFLPKRGGNDDADSVQAPTP